VTVQESQGCPVKTVKVEGEKPKAEQKLKLTPAQKLNKVVQKIDTALGIYEDSDAVDSWNMEFKVGELYGSKCLTKLERSTRSSCAWWSLVSAEKIKLLTFYERGSMYNFPRNSDDRFRQWKDVCYELDICRRTVDRCIINQ